MQRRGSHRTGVRRVWAPATMALALALAIPALAAAAVLPDVSDTPAGAQAVEQLPTRASELLEHPGDQDWYSILGRNADDSVNAVFVRVLESTATCAAPQAVTVALFNPEGRWMRTARSGSDDVATVLIPANPDRYSLDVHATDPACGAIEYEVTYVGTDPPKSDSTATRCLVARAKRQDARHRLDVLRGLRARLTPGAQTRYDGYIKDAKSDLTRLTRSQKTACT